MIELTEKITHKTDMKNFELVKKNLSEGSLNVCIIGIGRIGLPTALSFAKSGLQTTGVDINATLIDTINSGNFPLKDELGYEKIFNDVINSKKFSATTKIEDAVPNSDVIILSLPTPMNENNIPDYSALTLVGSQLSKLLQPDSLVIVESTIEPGFIENELIKIIEESGKLKIGEHFLIGVCPENANPGEILHDFNNLPRLVGAIDSNTLEIITSIYNHVFPVELIKMPNCKTANAVKLTTNVFRDINIGFINELALLFEKLGIDIFTVLDAAKRKYNFQIHYPGAGVGGPCLPINSYQLLNSAKKTGTQLSIVQNGRKINESMPKHVIELVIDGLREAGKSIEKCNILILGITYKPDVKDLQLTPAEKIVTRLVELGSNVKIYDPYFKSTTVFNIETESDLNTALSGSDALIFVTAHKEFFEIETSFLASKMETPVVIDSRGIIDIPNAKKAGLIFRGLGRGRI